MTKQIVWTLLVRVLLIAAGFVSSIITARFLGPGGRGVFFYWSTLAALAVQFGNLGLHSSNTYLLTKGRARLSVLASNSLWISLVGGALLSVALIVFIYSTNGISMDDWWRILPTVLLIPTGLYFLFTTNLLVAEDRIGEYNVFELANRYVALLAMLFAAWYWRTPEALLITMSVFALLTCFPLYVRMRNLDTSQGFSLKLLREGFAYSMRAYLATALGFVVLRMNALFLDRFSDPVELGIWSIAAQMMDVLIVIPSTIALVLLPKIMRSDQSYLLMKEQLGIVAALILSLSIIILWLGQPVIVYVYGEIFESAYTMLLWGLPGVFALSLITIISQYLASVGMPLSLVVIWFCGLMIEIFFAFSLIPSHGGAGAMMSLSAAYIIILGVVWFLAANHHRTKHTRLADL